MKALFAFIGMAVVILALIEINERRKAKKKSDISFQPSDCKKEQSETENCSDCSLMEICDKSSKSTDAQ